MRTPPTSSCGRGEGFDFQAAWRIDAHGRYHPDVMTRRLRDQVPVLEFVQWSYSGVEPGRAQSVLPLATPAINQHCTHQGALLLLAADYTGGAALGSLLPGWPVVGIHPLPDDRGVALWLVKGEIEYFRPSCGRLLASAEVEPHRHERVQRRFLQGRPVVESVTVHFHNGSLKVAEAEMTYYARRLDKLRDEGTEPDQMSSLYQHKIVSSAEMIAGVRARENGRLFEDPFSQAMAGEHGIALAERFCRKLPPLGRMVAARTRHLDDQILAFADRGGRDLVLLGVGYDMRPFRLPLPSGTRVFELDLPIMLRERHTRLSSTGVGDLAGIERISVPIDLRATSLSEALEGRLRSGTPVFVAWEGVTMYLEEEEVRQVLRGMAPTLQHPRSRVWMDFVDARAILNSPPHPSIEAFIEGMQVLGEPFRFGPDSVRSFVEGCGFHCHQVMSSDAFFTGQEDPIGGLYGFCVAAPAQGLSHVI